MQQPKQRTMHALIKEQLHRFFTLIVGLLLLSQPIHAQFTLQDSIYFDSTITDYQNWLSVTHLDEVLTYDKWTFGAETLDVYLTTSTKEDWIHLRNYYRSTYQYPIHQKLLEKLVWQLSIENDEVRLHITSSDGYTILIQYENGEWIKQEPLPDEISLKGNFNHELHLDHIETREKAVSQMDIKTAKSLIINYFKGYYEEKKVWWKKAKYESIDYENEISLEISNISKEILNDFLIGYYELILIDIFIEEKPGGIEINYTLKGKYGSGIFAAPRRSGYKDMSAKYPDYIERYNKKFRSMLKEVLEAKIIKQ